MTINKFTILLGLIVSLSVQIIKCQIYTEVYRQLNLENFKRGDFSRCIHLTLLNFHNSKIQNDSSACANNLFQLAFLYKTVNKKYNAIACYNLGLNYLNHVNFKNKVDLVKGYLFENSTTNKVNQFRDSIWCYFSRFSSLQKFVNNSDTISLLKNEESFKGNWFGYTKVLNYVGYYYLGRLKIETSYNYFLTGEELGRTLGQFDSTWFSNFYYLVYSGLKLKDRFSVEKQFQNVEKFTPSIIKKKGYYLFVRGTYYLYNSMLDESLNSFEIAYNLKDNSPVVSRSLLYNLLVIKFNQKKYNDFLNLLIHYPYSSYLLNIMKAYCLINIGQKAMAKCILLNIKMEELTSITDYNLMKECYMLLNNLDEAEKIIHNQYKYSLKVYGEYSILSTQTLDNLAFFYWISRNNIPLAVKYYNKAVYNIINQPENSNILEVPEISNVNNYEILATMLRNKAEGLIEIGKNFKDTAKKIEYYKSGLKHFERSIESVLINKSQFIRIDQKLNFAEIKNHYFPFIFDICSKLYDLTKNQYYLDKTFEYIERSKSSILYSNLVFERDKIIFHVPEELTNNDGNLMHEANRCITLIALENLNRNKNLELIDSLYSRLTVLKNEENRITSIYQNKYPLFYKNITTTLITSPDSLKSKLGTNKVFLEYSFIKDHLIVFVIDNQNYKLIQDTVLNGLTDSVQMYHVLLSGYIYESVNKCAVLRFESLSNFLYQHLLMPAENYFKGKELIISADNILNYIPFETLITNKNSNKKNLVGYQNLNYLIKTNPVNYCYSASLYDLLNTGLSHSISAKVLSLAPIITDSKNMKNAENEEIPGALDEAITIQKIMGGRVLKEKKATEHLFKEISGNYNLIHFATHGYVNEKEPLLSHLVLQNDSFYNEDGSLYPFEIEGLPINAPLVVLSACNSGYGKLYNGEGVFSIARSFYKKGTKNVIMSLWPVVDKSGTIIMEDFYRNLAENKNVTLSLKNAKTHYLELSNKFNSHPYFWAVYVCNGNPDISYTKPKSMCKTYIFILSFFVVGVMLSIYLKRKRIT